MVYRFDTAAGAAKTPLKIYASFEINGAGKDATSNGKKIEGVERLLRKAFRVQATKTNLFPLGLFYPLMDEGFRDVKILIGQLWRKLGQYKTAQVRLEIYGCTWSRIVHKKTSVSRPSLNCDK